MDNLVVDNQLPTTVIDDQCSNAASAVCERCLDLPVEPTLVDDSQALFDITSLGHADDQTIGTYIENAVLLVDWTEHALHVDAGLRVGHEGTLFLKLTSEQIHAQVSVLTCLWRGGDADDLAWTALENDEIADADELAGDRDSLGRVAAARLDKAHILADTVSHAARTTSFVVDDDLFAVIARAERVCDALGSTLETTAEGGVLALVVVVTHVVAARLVDFDVFFLDLDFCRAATFVFNVVGRVDAAAVVALSYVELSFKGLISGLISCVSAIDVDVDFSIVSTTGAFDVDVDVAVFVLDWLPVAKDCNQQVFLGVNSFHSLRSKHRSAKLQCALVRRDWW